MPGNKGTFGMGRPGNYYPGNLAIGAQAVSAGGDSALVVGRNCVSGGYKGTVVGINNSAPPFAVSSSTTLSGNYGPPIGSQLFGAWNFGNNASYGSVAIGLLNNQTGTTLNTDGSIKGVPKAATSIGKLSIAIGINNIAATDGSIVIGRNNTNANNTSTATNHIIMGINNNTGSTYRPNVVMFGMDNTSTGGYTVVLGRSCIGGDSSVAIGIGCNNSSVGSMTIGIGSSVSGDGASVFGRSNTSSGHYSVNIGLSNSLVGEGAATIGLNNSAAALNSQLFGKYNFASSTSFASVGVGILNNQTGGTLNTTTGGITGSPVVGSPGLLSMAFGINNTTSGIQAIAIGYNNTASGNYSVAIGHGITASTNNTVVIGPTVAKLVISDVDVGVIAATSTTTAKIGGMIFNHFTDVSSTHTDGTEDDLYTDTTTANILGTNGDSLESDYCILVIGSATATRRIQAYFGNTAILDSGTLTFASGGNADIWITIIRETSTVVRVKAEFVPSGITLQPVVTYTRITGLTLSGTNILKITGIAASTGAASGDIVAKLGTVKWFPTP